MAQRSDEGDMIDSTQLYKIYGTDFREMTVKLLQTVGLGEKIPSVHSKIGIKPNLVCPSPAEFGATTHPQIVAGIIEYLQSEGFKDIVIAEGSWVGDKTAEAYEYCGYRALSEEYDVPFIDTQKDKWHEVDCGGLKLQINDIVDEIDFLINVPVLKGHCQTMMTCALKNMKGLIPNVEKRHFHSMGLHDPIAHLALGIKPDFIVVDHICGDPDFEEGGNPRISNCIMAALDPVAVDSYACETLGLHVENVPYVMKAHELGVGEIDLEQISVHTIDCDGGIRVQSAAEEFKQVADAHRHHRVLDVSYAVEEIDSCSACYGNLIPALYRLKEEGLLDRLNVPIAIGQGQQGQKGKLGIGRCTKDFDVCVMGCPPDEEKIYRALREYISGQITPPL